MAMLFSFPTARCWSSEEAARPMSQQRLLKHTVPAPDSFLSPEGCHQLDSLSLALYCSMGEFSLLVDRLLMVAGHLCRGDLYSNHTRPGDIANGPDLPISASEHCDRLADHCGAEPLRHHSLDHFCQDLFRRQLAERYPEKRQQRHRCSAGSPHHHCQPGRPHRTDLLRRRYADSDRSEASAGYHRRCLYRGRRWSARAA